LAKHCVTGATLALDSHRKKTLNFAQGKWLMATAETENNQEENTAADTKPIQRIVILGAGYAGLHVAQRLTARLDSRHSDVEITLVDKNSYHQCLPNCPSLRQALVLRKR
jgi:hypothetical protein